MVDRIPLDVIAAADAWCNGVTGLVTADEIWTCVALHQLVAVIASCKQMAAVPGSVAAVRSYLDCRGCRLCAGGVRGVGARRLGGAHPSTGDDGLNDCLP
jgi:hypothetical protein